MTKYISSAGTDDLKKLTDNGEYYVDKTLAIKELLEAGGDIFLMTRPRRFGKTLMLTMIQYFFEKTDTSNDYLFKNKKIWGQVHPALGPYKDMQGKYPVIKLNFKDIESSTWDAALSKFAMVISREFNRHRYLLNGEIIDADKKIFEKILRRTATQTDYESSLLFLSTLLYNYHKQKVMFVLDEYDVPIHAAYVHGYYEDIISFIKPLLSSILKSNATLERGFITGALHIAKAGIFTGLNNLAVFNLTSDILADKFGFTDQEVKKMLADFNLPQHYAEIKAWYNGYHIGELAPVLVYNPWSMVNCLKNKGKISSYWVNTSENLLLRRTLGRAGEETKKELEDLLNHEVVTREIDESILVPSLDYDASSVWTMLLFTGHLTYTKIEGKGSPKTFTLCIPNEEVRGLYLSLLKSIFSSSIKGNAVNNLFQALREGNIEFVQELVESFVRNSMNFFDIPKKEPERSYHLFVLGLFATLNQTHEVTSNNASGLGRYDVMIIPRNNIDTQAFVIEFKRARIAAKLSAVAQEALDQIVSKDYVQTLNNRGFKDNNIMLYGMSFYEKKVFVVGNAAAQIKNIKTKKVVQKRVIKKSAKKVSIKKQVSSKVQAEKKAVGKKKVTKRR